MQDSSDFKFLLEAPIPRFLMLDPKFVRENLPGNVRTETNEEASRV
jgi:hypothetical protein